jgi:signal peptidase I
MACYQWMLKFICLYHHAYVLVIKCSGSMEPAFQRGDILFLNNQDSPIRVGEIVVFKIKDRDIPIVHRVMKVHEKEDGKVISVSLFMMVYRKDADESFEFN